MLSKQLILSTPIVFDGFGVLLAKASRFSLKLTGTLAATADATETAVLVLLAGMATCLYAVRAGQQALRLAVE